LGPIRSLGGRPRGANSIPLQSAAKRNRVACLSASMQLGAPRHLACGAARNTHYQSNATPYLGRTSTGWITPACGWRTYSITSSASNRSDAGTVRPSTLAVLTFSAISNFTGT
jgi:hypothetical protein